MPARLSSLVCLLAALCAGGSAVAAEESAPGQLFSTPPDHLDALIGAPGDASLEAVQAHLEAGDTRAALWEASRLTSGDRWGRDRDAAWMVQAMLHRESGAHNLASPAFTKVRSGKGPLASLAAYYEAEQDLERGKPWVAVKECETYRKETPTGPHADDCLRLMAIAWAKAGSWTRARDAAAEYDKLHPNATVGEQVELTLVLGAVRDEPDAMIPRLQQLAVKFDAPLTGRVAVETLDALRQAGHEGAVLPSDPMSRRSRAYSLRNTKQTHAAWQAFAEIAATADDDPDAKRWIEAEAETFGWRTRNWDFLVEHYTAAYAATPKSEIAWNLYRAMCRGGRHVEARDLAEVSLKAHASTTHWTRKEEDIARGHLLARDYARARELFDVVGARGGWTGQRGRYYAAFARVMAGDDDADALKRLDLVVDKAPAWANEGRYWRAKVHARNGRLAEARADFEAVVSLDPDSWYGALARLELLPEQADVARRDGRWADAPAPAPPVFSGSPPPRFTLDLPVGAPARGRSAEPRASFGFLTWDAVASRIAPAVPAESHPLIAADRGRPPRSYLAGLLFDKLGAARDLRRISDQHAAAWPELRMAFDLARAGLYDLSGPMFSAFYEEWRSAYRSPGNLRHAAARQINMPPDQWRGLFYLTRDHHHVARHTYGMWDQVTDPELARAARKLGYPLAHDRVVWAEAREHGIDPYLVLGLMRQESTYNPLARSPVGATGAMQIMPRTGHLMADLKHDLHFTAGDLEDPILSVGYGIAYLGLLMERFDGAYPLAIASYNGGPFNVSAWLAGTGREMPMDAWVEHVPFRETRDYVKKVSAGYSAYLSLYAPEGTVLAPPATPRGDRREVVDF